MSEVNIWDASTVVLAGFATLAIFSFLYRENPFYRFFEHLFIGLAAGLGPVLTVRDFLWPKILEPMLGWNVVQFPDGSFSSPYQNLTLLYLLPMAFGLLYYTLFSQRHNWLAKLVIGFSLGVSGGLAFKGFFNEVIPQLVGSFKPIINFNPDGSNNWYLNIRNSAFVMTLLLVMYYFFFTFGERKGASKSLSVGGRWLMMVCFGAFFGSTVMARLALLVERVQFLLEDWRIAFGQLKDIVFKTFIG